MEPVSAHSYPWFALASGREPEQGDILADCPRYSVSKPTTPDAEAKGTRDAVLSTVKAIILTQSCDMAFRQGRPLEVPQVLLCGFFFTSELEGERAKADFWNDVIAGKRPRYHALKRMALPGREADFGLIDFRQVFTLGFDEVMDLAGARSPRPRLMPPYREHLSQAFARLFMRVGLPADIPRFEKPAKGG